MLHKDKFKFICLCVLKQMQKNIIRVFKVKISCMKKAVLNRPALLNRIAL